VAAVAALMMALPAELMASSRLGLQWLQVNVRLRAEYDDNAFQTETDETDSSKIIVEPELAFNLNGDQTFLALNYRPQFVSWSGSDAPDSSVNHNVDVTLNHNFTPRLAVSIKDLFRNGEQNTLSEDETDFSKDSQFTYNSANGSLMFKVSPETRVDLSARHQMLRYDRDAQADIGDYDIVVGGVDLRHQFLPETTLVGELRAESTDYTEADDRSSSGVALGVAAEQMFNPNLIGNGRVGLQHKSFDDDGIDDSDTPYIEANLTILPSPATRVTTGLGYDQSETEVYPFANQQRFRIFAGLGYDLTARMTWDLTASYSMSKLEADEALSSERTGPDGTVLADGDENVVQVSTRLSYRLNRSNSVELGWQFVDLDSDVRENYARNRLSLGWKTEI
jgi:hypothetical protein